MVGAGNVLSNTLPPSKDGFMMTTVEINVEVSLDSHREKLRQCNSKIFSQGKTFTGIGPTPSIAKIIAAEAAVHHIATIMSNLATTNGKLGRHDEAFALCKGAYLIYMRAGFGASHPSVTNIKIGIAMFQRKNARLAVKAKKIQSNATCPHCKSVKKYKKCCGKAKAQ